MIKVVVTGSESTGKTELARALGAHYRAPVAEEFVRAFARRHDGRIGFTDHGAIARGQMASEDAAIAHAGDLVILDTDLVSTVVYCEHYFGRVPDWIVEAARARAAQLYLLLAPDVPWVPDGIRDRGQRREELHALFAATLNRLAMPTVEVAGDWQGRFDAAVRTIDALR